jgi:hypothetical protein
MRNSILDENGYDRPDLRTDVPLCINRDWRTLLNLWAWGPVRSREQMTSLQLAIASSVSWNVCTNLLVSSNPTLKRTRSASTPQDAHCIIHQRHTFIMQLTKTYPV